MMMSHLESWWKDKVHPGERNVPGRPVASWRRFESAENQRSHGNSDDDDDDEDEVKVQRQINLCVRRFE